MKYLNNRAFTLIELLIVIGIVAVLAGIILPVYGNVQLAGRKTQAMSNMRQLGAAALSYCNDNNGSLPPQGDQLSWQAAAASSDAGQWYNVLPRTYGNGMGLGDYANNPAGFYTKTSMFYVPAAKYPSTKLTAPQFAIQYNSKLYTSTYTNVRLQEFSLPAETVLFQEGGLVGETPIKGQKAYSATQSYGYASRTVARYNGSTILTFVDGHAGVFTGTSIVDPTTGKAYFAAPSASLPAGAAKIYWSMVPSVSPN